MAESSSHLSDMNDIECFDKYMEHNVTDNIVFEFLQSMMGHVVDNWDAISMDEYGDTEEHKSEISDIKYHNENNSIYSNSIQNEQEILTLNKLSIISKSSETTFGKNSISQHSSYGEENAQEPSFQLEQSTTPQTAKTVPRKIKVILKSGCVYKGCIVNSMMDGFGRFRWTDGSQYEGMFSNNKIEGRGKMIWPDLCWYEGQFLNGRRHGFGTFFVANSNITYRGEWSFSKRHGKGRIIYNDNQCYDGEWYEDHFNGNGKRSYDCKTWYYGNWCMGKRQGYGSMCWSNNDYYRGDWLDGLMHGYGKYTWDGVLFSDFVFQLDNTYIGMWKFGERDGVGTLALGHSNGAVYEGQFHKNFKHGEGKIVCGNGKIIHNCPLFQYDNPFHVFPSDHDGGKHVVQTVDRIPQDKMIIYNPKNKFNYKLKCDCVDCNCDPKHLLEKDRIHYCIQSTIDIPIHESVHTIDLSYHLMKISKKNIIQKNELHHILRPATVSQDYDQISDHTRKSLINAINTKTPQYQINPDRIIREENCIYNCFVLHLPRLWEIYRFYCNICCQDYLFADTKYKGVLIRLFLWQMYRDCNLISKISLINTDILLAKNKATLMKSIHYPFERIYFWQFLHSLLAIAWELYGDSIDGRIFGDSLLASVLHKFLQDDIYKNIQPYKHTGVVLFKYRDIAPLKGMYEFYQNESEPMSARQFIQLFVPSKVNKHTTVLQIIRNKKCTLFCGINTMVFNSKSYVSRKDILWGNIDNEKCDEILESENDSHHKCPLGILNVIDSLSVVCPLFLSETLNIEYRMNFLEFYEVLIECLVRSFDLKLKQEKKSTKDLQVTEPIPLSKRNWSTTSKRMHQKSNFFNMSRSFHAKSKNSLKSRPSSVSKNVIRNYSIRSAQGLTSK